MWCIGLASFGYWLTQVTTLGLLQPAQSTTKADSMPNNDHIKETIFTKSGVDMPCYIGYSLISRCCMKVGMILSRFGCGASEKNVKIKDQKTNLLLRKIHYH